MPFTSLVMPFMKLDQPLSSLVMPFMKLDEPVSSLLRFRSKLARPDSTCSASTRCDQRALPVALTDPDTGANGRKGGVQGGFDPIYMP